jgi:translation elongation factor EF-Ts
MEKSVREQHRKRMQEKAQMELQAASEDFRAYDKYEAEKKHQQKKQTEKHFYRNNRKPYEKIANITQQRLDEILDKINLHGYSFLTDEEKAFLERASNDDE